MSTSSEAEQMLSAFISQLLSGVVESVRHQGYQVSFLASKCGDGRNDILSLHGGLSLSIQKQLEVNFKNLITEAAQNRDCSSLQPGGETEQSNHTASISITDALAAASSCDDLTSSTRGVTESAAHMDTFDAECNSEFVTSLTCYTEYPQTTDNDADIPEEYNDGEILDDGQMQPLQIKTELPHDLQIESDDTLTRSYPDPERYSEHLRGKKKCKYCTYTTGYKSKLMCHMMSHTSEKPFACTECPYRSTVQANLKTHYMTHTGEKPFACPQCPYRSKSRPHLKRHILTHMPTEEKPFACPECPFRTTEKASLKKHIMGHTGEKPYACPDCPYKTTSQSHLNRHILTHTGEKPFACPQCPYRCADQGCMRRHIMTHTGEKPFTCPECPHRSRKQSHMKQHILTHRPEGEKPFACPECPYRSIEQRNLNIHMLKHSEEKL